MNLSVILPTKDEEDCIGKLIEKIRDLNLGLSLIVVDDSDNTRTKFSAEKAARNFNVSLRYMRGAGNESPSCNLAMELCGTEFCIIMDADLSQDPNIIPEMISRLEKGYDLVVGSSYAKGGGRGSRTIFSPVGNGFARRALGLRTKDCTSRFLAGKTATLLKASKWDGRGENCIDVINFYEKMGLSVGEVPFVQIDRVAGNSKTNIPKYLWKYFWKVIKLKKANMGRAIGRLGLLLYLWNFGRDTSSPDFEWWEWNGFHPIKRWWKRKMWSFVEDFMGIIPHESKILVLGCGSSPSINRLFGYTTGVDFNHGKIDFLRGNTNCQLFVANIVEFDSNEKFDYIIASEVMEYLSQEERRTVINKMPGWLAEGGRIIFSFPDSNSFISKIVEKILHKNERESNGGFVSISLNEIAFDCSDNKLLFVRSKSILGIDSAYLFKKGG